MAVMLPLALMLRLYHIDFQNLWLDEALTWSDSQLPTYWLLRRSALNVHPPGVFLLMKGWTALFGSSPAALRLPFALSSLLIIILTFKLTRLMLPASVAVLAAALLALSPYQIYFAQEARMYTVVTVLTLGIVYCYLRLRAQPNAGWGYPLGFVVLSVAALHTHYFSLFILLTVNVDGLRWYLRTQSPLMPLTTQAKTWVRLNGIIALACVPWMLFVILHPAVGRVGHEWRMLITITDGLMQLRDLGLHLLVGYFIYPQDLALAFHNYQQYPEAVDARQFFFHRLFTLGVGVAVMIGLFIKGGLSVWRQAPLIFMLLLIPLMLTLAVMFLTQRDMVLSRYLMMTSPYFFIILATGILSFKLRLTRFLVGSALTLAMSLALMTYYDTPARGSDYRPLAQYLKQNYQLGDVIVADPAFMDRCLQYYLADTPALYSTIINTEAADTATNYLTTHVSLPGVWLILDYRSDLFSASPQSFQQLWPHYEMRLDMLFPEHPPKVRLLRLEFVRESGIAAAAASHPPL